MDQPHVLSVSELNATIRTMLENRFPFVRVAGEVSNLRKPYSGHLYFTLKDEKAQIKTVLFKMQQRYLEQEIKDGTHIVCNGRLSVYEPRGDYQLIVDTIDFQGKGLLQLQFEQLKQKLATQGLFDEHQKKTLPTFPRHITLITSPQGAAVHDFIKVATRRFPLTGLAVYPVAVQGDQAASEMSQAIADLNNQDKTDIIVLCRGGGSIEDLWAFNEEKLALAIYHSRLPVVSAVGHEIDFTIADFTADFRAPTPSSGAELILPDSKNIRAQLENSKTRLCRSIDRELEQRDNRLRINSQRLGAMPHPLDALSLQLDQLSLSLELSMTSAMAAKKQQLDAVAFRLEQKNPITTLLLYQQKFSQLHQRFTQATRSLITTKKGQLQQQAAILDAVSPLATLARGYSIVKKRTAPGIIISDASKVNIGEAVEVTLHRGELYCRVESKKG